MFPFNDRVGEIAMALFETREETKVSWPKQFAGTGLQKSKVCLFYCATLCVCVGRDCGGIYPNLLFILSRQCSVWAKASLASVFALTSITG
jgi:hypothetical protein